jgi:hypothetical protein
MSHVKMCPRGVHGDEYECQCALIWKVKRQTLADLRETVEILPDARRVRTRSGKDYGKWQGDGSIWRAHVLALLEEPQMSDREPGEVGR